MEEKLTLKIYTKTLENISKGYPFADPEICYSSEEHNAEVIEVNFKKRYCVVSYKPDIGKRKNIKLSLDYFTQKYELTLR